MSFLGYDYTEHVKTEEDVKLFNRLCECEKETKGVAIKDCIKFVAETLNIDPQLRSLRRKVHVQGNCNLN